MHEGTVPVQTYLLTEALNEQVYVVFCAALAVHDRTHLLPAGLAPQSLALNAVLVAARAAQLVEAANIQRRLGVRWSAERVAKWYKPHCPSRNDIRDVRLCIPGHTGRLPDQAYAAKVEL